MIRETPVAVSICGILFIRAATIGGFNKRHVFVTHRWGIFTKGITVKYNHTI
jgi:hypothetical protein